MHPKQDVSNKPTLFVNGLTASADDLRYAEYWTGSTVSPLFKPQPAPEQINAVFGPGGVTTNPEATGYTPSPELAAAVHAVLQAKVDQHAQAQTAQRARRGK